MTRRILITGASGFLGWHCCEAFAAAGWDVIALSRSGRAPEAVAERIKCDLLDVDDMRRTVGKTKASHLLHMAWHDGPRDRWVSPANLDWAAASIQLARTFAETVGERFILAGSCAQYDWTAGPILSEADTPLNPASLYGAAKVATSQLLDAAQTALGLSIVEARVFFCYGPGEPAGRLLPDLITGLRAGNPVDCTDGLQMRDYLHAGDIARAIETVAASNLTGAVNIASGEGVAVRDLIEEVARQLGRPDLPQFGKIKRAPNDPLEIYGEVKRLRGLGFQPQFDLKSGIADTLSRWP